MIVRALLVVGVAAALGLIAAAVLGYLLPPAPAQAAADATVAAGMPRHVLMALASTLLLLFSHCWIFLYLIATDRVVRKAVREFGLEPELGAETAGFKRAAFPWLLAAVGLALATMVCGGAALTGSVPVWVHHVFFYATLLVQAGALWTERRVLGANERFLSRLDRRLGPSPSSPSSSPPSSSPVRAQGVG